MNPTAVRGLLLLLLLIGSATGAAAQDAFLQEKGKGQLWLYGGGGSTRIYFNAEGNQRLFDSLQTSFTAFTLGGTLDYGILDGLEANVDLPIGYYAVTSTSRFPDRAIVAPAWLGIGATYRLTSAPLATAVSATLRIPPGFHNGIYDDPNHPSFLSDGFVQAIGALHLGWSGESGWAKGRIGYAFRAEEPVDEIQYGLQAGFSSIPGTGVYIGIDGVIATEDPSMPTRPFYAGAAGDSAELARIDGGVGRVTTIERESYMTLVPGAFIDLGERITLSMQYQIRLFGVHSLRINGLYVAGGYRF